MDERMDSKVVVITGAGSGIGRETALLCARRGATVALCDVNAEGLEETAQQARATTRDVLTERVDVADAEAMEAFAAAVHERFDHVDLLINNAGIGVVATFLETEMEDWRRLVEINLMGVVYGCRGFVPQMVQRRSGHVVNVSSQAGYQASAPLIAYSMTKFGVFGFSEALRADLGPHGIGVTWVCPGIVNTPITRTSVMRGGNVEQRREKVAGLYARRGYGPEKVAVRILKAAAKNKAVAPITPEAHVGYVLSRVAPPLSRWLTAKLAAVSR